MRLLVPYETSGQELGETRQAMSKRLMQDIEDVVNKFKNIPHFYILVHAKPYPHEKQKIKIKIIAPIPIKPSMMLSCMVFEVNNKSGELKLCYSLPGDWPTYTCGGTSEPVPETIASINESGVKYHYDSFVPDEDLISRLY